MFDFLLRVFDFHRLCRHVQVFDMLGEFIGCHPGVTVFVPVIKLSLNLSKVISPKGWMYTFPIKKLNILKKINQ